MFCVNCGEKLNEGEMVCHKCGVSQVPATGENPIENQVNNEVVQPANQMMNNPEPVQNMVNQPVNTAPVNNGPVNNGPAANGDKKWLVPVLIGIIVVLAIVVVFFLLDKNNSGSGVGGRDIQNTTTPGGGSTVAVEDTIDYSGYKFKKVAGFSYQIDDGALLVTDQKTFATMLIVENVSWAQVKASLLDENTIRSLLTQSGFDSVSNPKNESYGGKEFVTYEVAQGNDKGIYYFTDLDGVYMSEGFVINPTYTVDYTTMSNVGTVYSGVTAATYANSFGVTNNSSGFGYFHNN